MIKHELGDGCDAALEVVEKGVELGRGFDRVIVQKPIEQVLQPVVRVQILVLLRGSEGVRPSLVCFAVGATATKRQRQEGGKGGDLQTWSQRTMANILR